MNFHYRVVTVLAILWPLLMLNDTAPEPYGFFIRLTVLLIPLAIFIVLIAGLRAWASERTDQRYSELLRLIADDPQVEAYVERCFLSDSAAMTEPGPTLRQFRGEDPVEVFAMLSEDARAFEQQQKQVARKALSRKFAGLLADLDKLILTQFSKHDSVVSYLGWQRVADTHLGDHDFAFNGQRVVQVRNGVLYADPQFAPLLTQ